MSNSDQRLITGVKALAPESKPWHAAPASQGLFQADENGSLLSLETLAQPCSEHRPEYQLLGVCEGLPGQPGIFPVKHQPEKAIAPGSLLVIGDPGSGKTRLLRRLLVSAAAHNTPAQAGFYLIAHQPAQFCDIGHLEHCRLVMQTYDRSLGSAVQELVDLAEERRAGKQRGLPPSNHMTGPAPAYDMPGPAPANHMPGPAVILVIDDLASALLSLEEQSITLLYWLIRHGPRQRVWTLATLSTRRLADLDLRFLEAFRSRVVGHISEPDTVQVLFQRPQAPGSTLANHSPLHLASWDLPRQSTERELPTWALEKGRQFFLPYGSGWVSVRLSEPQPGQCQGSAIHLWSGTA